jgi:hypothetical protein
MTFGAAPKAFKVSKTPKAQSNSKPGFKKSRPVQHVKFGVGIVEEIEKKNDGTMNVTVRFKSGVKKISSTFLQAL